MCRNDCGRNFKINPLVGGVAKFVVILTVIFFAECAAENAGFTYHRRGRVTKGSCLSYGHACWGAHGKRSGGHIQYPVASEELSNKDEARTKLFLSKLITPIDLLYYRGMESEKPLKRDDIEDIFEDSDKDTSKSMGDVDIDSLMKGTQVAERNGRTMDEIFKNARFMEKRSTNRHQPNV